MLLRNRPLSGVEREVSIAAQPFAGDNTASLEAHCASPETAPAHAECLRHLPTLDASRMQTRDMARGE